MGLFDTIKENTNLVRGGSSQPAGKFDLTRLTQHNRCAFAFAASPCAQPIAKKRRLQIGSKQRRTPRTSTPSSFKSCT